MVDGDAAGYGGKVNGTSGDPEQVDNVQYGIERLLSRVR